MTRGKDIDLGGGTFARPGKRKKHLKVYTTLYDSNARDVPKTLRKLAKEIESGKTPPVNEAAFVLDCADGEYLIYGFGPHYNNIDGTFVLFEMGKSVAQKILWEAKNLQKTMYKKPPPDDGAA